MLKQQQANIAAGYAVTYILGYILVLLFVPFVAPRLMGINLKDEATKLEIELAGGEAEQDRRKAPLPQIPGARLSRFRPPPAAPCGEIEKQIGRRVVIERILRNGEDVEPTLDAKLQAGDEILLAGPTAVIIAAAIAARAGDRGRARHAHGHRRRASTCSSPPATCMAGRCRRSSIASATRRAACSCAR